MDVSQKVDAANEIAKAAPPVLIAGSAHLMGFTLNEWVAIITIAYVVLQSAFLIWKWIRLAKEKRALDNDDE